MDEEEIEQIVDNKFQEVIAEEKIDQEIITTEIRKAVKGMRNKKAGDKNNQKTMDKRRRKRNGTEFSNSI